MSAPRDDAIVPSDTGGGASVSELAETTAGALIAGDASESPADDARGVRGGSGGMEGGRPRKR